MQEALFSPILLSERFNEAQFIRTVNYYIHDVEEHPEIHLQTKSECLQHIYSLKKEDFICMTILVINTFHELTAAQEKTIETYINLFLN